MPANGTASCYAGVFGSGTLCQFCLAKPQNFFKEYNALWKSRTKRVPVGSLACHWHWHHLRNRSSRQLSVSTSCDFKANPHLRTTYEVGMMFWHYVEWPFCSIHNAQVSLKSWGHPNECVKNLLSTLFGCTVSRKSSYNTIIVKHNIFRGACICKYSLQRSCITPNIFSHTQSD